VFNIGPQELLVILLVALVIVGPQRLPELSRTIGRGLREFRKAQDEVKKTIRLGLDETEPTSPGRTPAGKASEPVAGDAAAPDAEAGPASSETDAATDIARTLGRGLAEIRRTRREIQRTFRVDLSESPPATPTPRARTLPPAATPEAAPSVPPPAASPAPDPGPAEPGTPE
jgi:Tat protein translocase TatB subunit